VALNLKPEPIVIKRTVLKLMEVCCLHFMRSARTRFTPQCIALLNCGVGQNRTTAILYKSQDCLDEKETLKEFGDLNKTIFYLKNCITKQINYGRTYYLESF
jgi:hypothetical protein